MSNGTDSSRGLSEDDPLLRNSSRTQSWTGSDSNREYVRSFSSRLISHLSSHEKEHALKNLGIGPAAHLIRDAVLGERSPELYYNPYENPDRPIRNFLSALCARWVTNRWMVRLQLASAWALVMLTFIEPPAWCRTSDLEIVQGQELDDFGTCGVILRSRGSAADGSEGVQLYPNASSMLLTPSQARLVEASCLGIASLFLLGRWGRAGFDLGRFFQPGIVRRINLLQLAMLGYLSVAVMLHRTTYNPFGRLILLGTYLKSFQKELWSLFRMVSSFACKCPRSQSF